VFSGGFRRSGLFGLVGVFVVAGVVAAIALTTGEGQSNPKTTYALIFGVLAVFFIVLFALQRSDMEKVATGSVRGTERAVAEGGRPIENPTTMSEPELWAALAVKPIDAEAVKARSQMWDSGRRSLRLGMIVTLLIFLTVPSIYLFESFLPLLIGGPLIAIGLLTRPVAFLLAGEMLVAYLIGHAPRGPWPVRNGGMQALQFGCIFVHLVAAGPGSLAVDSAHRK